MQTRTTVPTYSTSEIILRDLYEAAYLELRGHPCEVRPNGSVALFVFHKSEELQRLMGAFIVGMDQVEVGMYAACVRKLKARMYSARDAGQGRGGAR